MIAEKPAPSGQLDEVVELRVHGVGGSSPEGLLAHKDSVQFGPPWKFAGDDITGFYRAEWDHDARGRRLEGYLWGGLTSRKASRALWLLLLPFSLANVAGWMVEPQDREPAHPTLAPTKPQTDKVHPLARVQMGLIRLFSAGMTILMIAWFGNLVVDQVAYQCGGQASCIKGRFWMAPFEANALFDYPGRRILVGVAILLLIVGLLAFLTFRSQNRYERRNPLEQGHKVTLGREGAGLSDREFWASGEYVRRLTYFHLGLAVIVVGGLYSLSLDALESGGGSGFGIGWLSDAFIIAALFYLLAIATLTQMPAALKTVVPYLEGKGIHFVWIGPFAATCIAAWDGWNSRDVVLNRPRPDGTVIELVAPGVEPVFSRALLYAAAGLLVVVLAVVVVRFLIWWRRPAKPGVVALGATAFWTLAIVVAVFWRKSFLHGLVDSRLVVGLIALLIVYMAWVMARRPDWRVVIAGIMVIGVAVLWIADADAYWPFWILAALTVLAVAVALVEAGFLFRIILGLVLLISAIAIWRIDNDENLALQWLGLGILGLSFLPTLGADLGRKDQWRWGGPISPVGLSLVVLMVGAAGSVAALADFLDRGEVAESATQPVIDFLSVYEVIALLLMAALVFTGLGAILHVLRLRADVWAGQRTAISESYEHREPEDEEPRDYYDCLDDTVGAAVTGRALGSAARDADVLITSLVTIALTAALVSIARLALGSGTGFLMEFEQPAVSSDWSPLVRAGILGAALLPAAGVGLVRNARKNEDVRKSIGTAWDVLTFWPRRFHPLAPPSYAERAVPELAERVKQLSRDGSKVMIVAHSQGSVVAASAVAYLKATGDLRFRRVYLVTHGNPLGRLYRRAFPGYWGGGFLRFLRRELGWPGGSGWLNMHRLTDPIGDQIFTGPDEHVRANPTSSVLRSGDQLLEDPPSRWAFDLDACPKVAGHSNYLKQAEAVEYLDDIGRGLSHSLISGQHTVSAEGPLIEGGLGIASPVLNVEVRFATDAVGGELNEAKSAVVDAVITELSYMHESGELAAIADEITDPDAQLEEAARRLRDIDVDLQHVAERIERVVLRPPQAEA